MSNLVKVIGTTAVMYSSSFHRVTGSYYHNQKYSKVGYCVPHEEKGQTWSKLMPCQHFDLARSDYLELKIFNFEGSFGNYKKLVT